MLSGSGGNSITGHLYLEDRRKESRLTLGLVEQQLGSE